MKDALSFLQLGLTESLSGGIHPTERWTEPARIARALAQVQREHGGAAILAPKETIMGVIAAFRATGTCKSFTDLKYVCLGMGNVDDRGWCVFADAQRRCEVLRLVERQTEFRRKLRCFQASLSSYWTFRLNDSSTRPEAIDGWRDLRSWLRSERSKLLISKETKPQWFDQLGRHVELLSDEPCKKFGAALLRGDSSELNAAMEGLAIPKDSWVLEEAVFAQISAAAAFPDEGFKEKLSPLLTLAMGKEQVEIGVTLRIRCVAQLVSRYARCKDRPEHMALREAAISTIGNPWLRRAIWDAKVVDGKGEPDDQAREMLNGWLKRNLIKNFFELLSVDGTGDPRRLDYWLRFEPLIEDMWFALGTDAQHRRDKDFDDFRASAKGRLLDLEDSASDNNAFVMRIGKYLAVEFGATGNAFYLFTWDSLDQPLINALTSGRARASASLRILKSPNNAARLIHRDSATERWEDKFDLRICPLLGHWPKDLLQREVAIRAEAIPDRRLVETPRPTNAINASVVRGPTEIEWVFFAQSNRLLVKDNRAKGGALWILDQNLRPWIVAQLEAWGFKHSSRFGWYKERL